MQISNIIDLCMAYKHNVLFNVPHPLFNLAIIQSYFSKYKNKEIVTDKFGFFYTNKLPYPSNLYGQYAKERNDLLKRAFLIKNIKALPEQDLVIHIRSGDIFSNKPHKAYVPPPLSYYVNEINKHKHDNIILVCEDRVNPVVNELLALYKNSTHTLNSLETDIRLLLGATTVVGGIGTFVPSLMLMSDTIKQLTIFDGVGIQMPGVLHFNYCHVNEDCNDYYVVMKPWCNTPTQRNYILTYNHPIRVGGKN